MFLHKAGPVTAAFGPIFGKSGDRNGACARRSAGTVKPRLCSTSDAGWLRLAADSTGRVRLGAGDRRMFSKARLDTLSDGIFGVAMTLLVLDVRLPENFHPH